MNEARLLGDELRSAEILVGVRSLPETDELVVQFRAAVEPIEVEKLAESLKALGYAVTAVTPESSAVRVAAMGL